MTIECKCGEVSVINFKELQDVPGVFKGNPDNGSNIDVCDIDYIEIRCKKCKALAHFSEVY